MEALLRTSVSGATLALPEGDNIFPPTVRAHSTRGLSRIRTRILTVTTHDVTVFDSSLCNEHHLLSKRKDKQMLATQILVNDRLVILGNRAVLPNGT